MIYGFDCVGVAVVKYKGCKLVGSGEYFLDLLDLNCELRVQVKLSWSFLGIT